MGKLTREEIETLIDDLIVAHPIYTPQLRALRAQALSLESVREEALEEIRRHALDESLLPRNRLQGVLSRLDALQHAPARVAEGEMTRKYTGYCSAEVESIMNEIEHVYRSDGSAGRDWGMMRDLAYWVKLGRDKISAPESPAKEQPGEQNAAPRPFNMGQYDKNDAAPDVAAMVKRLRDQAPFTTLATEALMLEAAALIEKLGQRDGADYNKGRENGFEDLTPWLSGSEKIWRCRNCGIEQDSFGPVPPARQVLASSDPEGHRQAISDGAHDLYLPPPPERP